MLIIFMRIYLKGRLASNRIFVCFLRKKVLRSNNAVGSSRQIWTVCFGKVKSLTCKMTPLVQHWRSGHWWHWRFTIRKLINSWWQMCLNKNGYGQIFLKTLLWHKNTILYVQKNCRYVEHVYSRHILSQYNFNTKWAQSCLDRLLANF